MKLNKDYIGIIISLLWFLSNLLSYYFFDIKGIIISNTIFTFIFSVFIINYIKKL